MCHGYVSLLWFELNWMFGCWRRGDHTTWQSTSSGCPWSHSGSASTMWWWGRCGCVLDLTTWRSPWPVSPLQTISETTSTSPVSGMLSSGQRGLRSLRLELKPFPVLTSNIPDKVRFDWRSETKLDCSNWRNVVNILCHVLDVWQGTEP